MNCIPDGMDTRELEHYDDLLEERRTLMAKRIRDIIARSDSWAVRIIA